MKGLVLGVLLVGAASSAGGQAWDFSTRDGCLRELSDALRSAEYARRLPEQRGQRISAAPVNAPDAVAAAVDALEREGRAIIDFAEALMIICQSYE